MHYNAEDAVYVIRAQAHTSVLRTIHDKHVVSRRRNPADRYVFAVLLPLFLTANFILYDQLRLQNEEVYHLAAPEQIEKDGIAVEAFDETLQDHEEAVQQICSNVCWEERIVHSQDKLVLINFCTDVCGIPFMEPVVVPEALIEPEPKEAEVVEEVQELEVKPLVEVQKQISVPPTIESLEDEGAIVRSSLEAVEKSMQKKPHDHIGMYLTSTSTGNAERLSSTIERTKNAQGNAVIFDVKGSYVYFDADSEIAEDLGLIRPIYDLKEIVEDLHEQDIYVMVRHIAVKDPSLASRRPETQIPNKFTGKGIGDVWVVPNHPYVLDYNREVVEAVVDAGVDEINFDYIRGPTEYDQRAIGLTGEEKADQIMEFLQMARDVVNEKNADTKIGVSTFAILGWNFPLNFEPLGQDIARFSELVDVISPMAYPSTFSPNAYYDPAKNPGSRNYYLVYRTLQGYKELLGEDSWKIRPWIQGYYMTSGGMKSQIEAVHDAGLCGFTVWNAQNNYKNTYTAMEGYEKPEHCL